MTRLVADSKSTPRPWCGSSEARRSRENRPRSARGVVGRSGRFPNLAVCGTQKSFDPTQAGESVVALRDRNIAVFVGHDYTNRAMRSTLYQRLLREWLPRVGCSAAYAVLRMLMLKRLSSQLTYKECRRLDYLTLYDCVHIMGAQLTCPHPHLVVTRLLFIYWIRNSEVRGDMDEKRLLVFRGAQAGLSEWAEFLDSSLDAATVRMILGAGCHDYSDYDEPAAARVKEALEDLATLWTITAPSGAVNLLRPAGEAGNELARAVYARWAARDAEKADTEARKLARKYPLDEFSRRHLEALPARLEPLEAALMRHPIPWVAKVETTSETQPENELDKLDAERKRAEAAASFAVDLGGASGGGKKSSKKKEAAARKKADLEASRRARHLKKLEKERKEEADKAARGPAAAADETATTAPADDSAGSAGDASDAESSSTESTGDEWVVRALINKTTAGGDDAAVGGGRRKQVAPRGAPEAPRSSAPAAGRAAADGARREVRAAPLPARTAGT